MGLTWREIGERLGLARQTVCDYYFDPAGTASAVRKHESDIRTRMVCPTCGGEMGPRRSNAAQCRKCANEEMARGNECRIQDVAEMYREGMSTREIAEALGYGPTSNPPEITIARRRGLLSDYRYDATRRERATERRWAA